MSRSLDDLAPAFRPLAFEFLARLTEAGVPVLITDTLRTPEEHQANLVAGTSWTRHSKHLDGLALDVVPYDLYTAAPGGDKLAWNANHPSWRIVGVVAHRLGLRWGGDWKQKDMGHVEFVEKVPA